MPEVGKRETLGASNLQELSAGLSSREILKLPAPEKLLASICTYLKATMIGDPPDHVRKWIEEHLRSLGWPDNGGTLPYEQCKEKVVGKLAQEGLEELRSKPLRVQSSDVVLTILQINTNLSFVEVALELLAFVSQPPGGSTREEKLQRFESQYFSPDLCTSEISVHELYRNLNTGDQSQAQFSTWYVLSGEHSSIMSCVRMLHKESSSRLAGSVESDLAQFLNTATLKLQAADDSTNHLLTFWVRPDLPCPHNCKRTPRRMITVRQLLANIIGCIFPMGPGVQAGPLLRESAEGTTFPGQLIFNGSRLAVYYLNQGDLFKLIAAVKASGTPDLPLLIKAREAPFSTAIDDCTELRVSVQLNLRNPRQGCTIVNVAALHRASSPHGRERMEFFFRSPEDMAACVGVGLPGSKVVLSNDLSVTVIQESEGDKWESPAPYLEQPSATSAVPSDHEDSGQRISQTGTQATDVITQTFPQPESGNDQVSTSKYAKLGVGSDEILHLNFETAEISQDLSRPLLYEIAWAILTQNRAAGQCSDGHQAKPGRPEEPESSHAGPSQSNSMLQNLDGNRQQECAAVQKQKGGSGNGEETSSCTVDSCTDVSVKEDDALPDVEMKVKVVPFPKRELVDTANGGLVVQLKDREFLEDASIAPVLEFVFCRTQGERRISIRTVAMLSLRTADKVTKDKDYFGWYHDHVSISLGCVKSHSDEDVGRAAYLEDSAQISNTVATSTKHSTGRTSTQLTGAGQNIGGSGRAGFSGFGATATIGGGKDWSKKKEESSSETENSEVTSETVCNGFLVQDRGNDTCVEFSLWHHLLADDASDALVWGQKARYLDKGLFSTICPVVEGTWIAVNMHEASPYALHVKRDLKLRHHPKYSLVRELEQSHRISFYINHSFESLNI